MMMRLYRKITILFLAVSLSSCESFLEVEEVGRSSIPVFFTDVEGIRAALPGAYGKVYDYYDSNFMLYPDAAGDMFNMIRAGRETYMIPVFNYQSVPQDEVRTVGRIWGGAYEALANVNNILEYQPLLLGDFPEASEELTRIKAEALFLRALIHFDLVRVYAQPYGFTEDAGHLGIPVLLQTPGPDDNVARSSVAEVYEQVIADLKLAEDTFMDDSKRDSYHASTQAVEALLARVYLYQEEWELAEEYATKALENTRLAEGEEYLEMFMTVTEGPEAIFRLNGYWKGSSVADFYSPAGPNGYASEKLLDQYSDTTDIRLDLINNQNNATLKYYLPGLSEEERQVDLFVLRASEMYLIRAEANARLNNLEEAAQDLKTIIARALQLSVSEVEIHADTREELVDLILEERAKELSFEGHRLFDLTRNERDLERHESVNSNVRYIEYPSPLFVLPIPETEINANRNIVPNPGY